MSGRDVPHVWVVPVKLFPFAVRFESNQRWTVPVPALLVAFAADVTAIDRFDPTVRLVDARHPPEPLLDPVDPPLDPLDDPLVVLEPLLELEPVLELLPELELPLELEPPLLPELEPLVELALLVDPEPLLVLEADPDVPLLEPEPLSGPESGQLASGKHADSL
jgi:hypothetical protein